MKKQLKKKKFWDELELKKCFLVGMQAFKTTPIWVFLVPTIALIIFVIFLFIIANGQ
ncbi:MAG: hypothetical protein SNF33_00290 (plasmid) [Candidatus Algichlamydia australiensis]|nr:hypothetical protein [Chlamydiales bacterium]